MKYVIDEEELKEYAEYCGWSFESMVKVLNLKSKTPVEDKQYKHIGYLEVHFSESASFEDNIRPVITLQTLTDCVKHKDGRYKIYIEVIK